MKYYLEMHKTLLTYKRYIVFIISARIIYIFIISRKKTFHGLGETVKISKNRVILINYTDIQIHPENIKYTASFKIKEIFYQYLPSKICCCCFYFCRKIESVPDLIFCRRHVSISWGFSLSLK